MFASENEGMKIQEKKKREKKYFRSECRDAGTQGNALILFFFPQKHFVHTLFEVGVKKGLQVERETEPIPWFACIVLIGEHLYATE